jgi:hypothetical protein
LKTTTMRLAVVFLVLAVVLGGGYGVLRAVGPAPGLGPLTDPGSQASDAGFTGGSDSVPVGVFSSGILDLVNFSHVSGVLDSISLDHASPGLELTSAYVIDRGLRCHRVVGWFVRPGVPALGNCAHPLNGFAITPHSGLHMRPPHIEVRHLSWPVLLVFRIRHPGTYSFRGIDVHYHFGPFHYTSTYKLGLTVCAPEAARCSYGG